jgi:hypothetical protein
MVCTTPSHWFGLYLHAATGSLTNCKTESETVPDNFTPEDFMHRQRGRRGHN